MLPICNAVRGNDTDFLLLNTDDAITNYLYKHGHWAPHLIEVARKFYHNAEAPLIVDIGAHIGGFSIPIAKEILASGGMVYAYEPQRIIFYQLCGSAVLNRLDNYFAFNLALGSSAGEVAIPEVNYAQHNNTGAFSIDKKYRELLGVEYFATQKQNKVPLITLDSIVLPKSPALIKVDAEGLELDILKGGVSFLKQHRFPPILFEAWNFEWFAVEKKALMDFFRDTGYVITPILTEDYIAQHPDHPVHVQL